ncbi:hypothetical protein [Pseudoclavibacter helvolus]|uniref:hypothetical protein n=1 Tax=Pseudoclavibacter helvolus TaxID=255205 RepID=UPI000837C12B|nr:hypothetical protein [Pseudoclavibacter helvolus]
MNVEQGFFAEKAASDELARALADELRPGDDAMVLLCTVLAPVSRKRMRAIRADGRSVADGVHYESLRTADPVSDAMDAVRVATYREGTGTWFSAKFTVTAAGAFTAEYNYDEEPVWDVPVDSIAYVTDQKRFPRDEEHQPEWLKAKLAEGRVRIAERDAREARERGE